MKKKFYNLHFSARMFSTLTKGKRSILYAFCLFLSVLSFNPSFSQSGQTLDFDGTNDYVRLPFGVSGNYTKEAWINMTGVGTTPNIISGDFTALYVNGTNHLSAGHATGGYTQVQDPTPLSLGVWYHVAVTYNSVTGDMNLYRDGLLVASATSVVAENDPFLELGRFFGGFNFPGLIDEVRIWNIERSASDIFNSMSCRLTDDVSGLVAYYDFEQGIAGGNNATETILRDRANFCSPKDATLNNFSLVGANSNWVSPGVVLSGFCNTVFPNVHLTGNGLCILSGDVTPAVIDGTDFGDYISTPIVKTFVLHNTGTSLLTVSSILSSTTDFTISGTPATIAAGATATFNITFLPSGILGTKTATITVSSDDADNAAYTFTVTGVYKQLGRSLNFDGVDDYVSLPVGLSGSYTKEAWVKPADVNGSPNILSGVGTAVYILNGQLSAGHSANGYFDVQDPASMVANQWYHVAVTYNGTTNEMKLYKDGILVDAQTSVGYSESGLLIGSFQNFLYFNGNIDEVRLWNYVRSAAEIAGSKDCQLNDDTPGLLAYYDFNQGAANNFNFTEIYLRDRHDTCVGLDGTLVNFNNSGNTSNWVIESAPLGSPLYCNGTMPNIKISGFGICILDGDLTPDASNGTDFGLYSSGNPVFRTFVVKNTGSSVLTLGQPVLSGPDYIYWVIVSNPATTVLPGDSTSFQVKFQSSTLGIKNAFITLTNNDGDEGNYIFAIRGERQQALAASLLSFNGILVGKEVKLNWNVTSERNSRGYQVLRSDGSQRVWEQIGFVASENIGNSTYTFFDRTPLNGVNTYRLKQVDMDGNSRLSNVVNISVINKSDIVRTYPNPFTENITIAFNDQKLLNSIAQIRTVTGAVVGTYRLNGYNTTLNVVNLAKGMYILSLANGEVIKLIKQ